MNIPQLLKCILYASGAWWANLVVAIAAKAFGASWAGSQFLVGTAIIYCVGAGCVLATWFKHL